MTVQAAAMRKTGLSFPVFRVGAAGFAWAATRVVAGVAVVVSPMAVLSAVTPPAVVLSAVASPAAVLMAVVPLATAPEPAHAETAACLKYGAPTARQTSGESVDGALGGECARGLWVHHPVRKPARARTARRATDHGGDPPGTNDARGILAAGGPHRLLRH
jgi:hypothetical protein